MTWRTWWAASLLGIAAACSPVLDWREVRPEGSGARALFPCRPVSHARTVALSGAPVRMTIHSCSAGEMMFALGFADTADPTRVGAALAELRAAAQRNLDAAPVPTSPLAVSGMTPNAEAVRLRLTGRRPDGSPVHEELALFARGTVVYQATLIGSALDAAAVQTFVDGLRLGS